MFLRQPHVDVLPRAREPPVSRPLLAELTETETVWQPVVVVERPDVLPELRVPHPDEPVV